MRNVAARNAMGPSQAPPPAAHLRAAAGRGRTCRRRASRCCSKPPSAGSADEVQVLGHEFAAARSRNGSPRCEIDCAFVLYRADPALTPWTELCLRQADCLVVVRNADTDEPTRLPFEIEAAQPGAVFHRRRELVLLHEGHDPKPGIDGRPARRRAVRPASSCAARPAVRFRPAGAADHRPCGRHRHGRRRRARLHPYRRGQGAARLGRADRPGRRHQHGRDRRRRGRRALDRRGAGDALPPLFRHTPIRSATTPCRSCRCSAADG